MRTNTRQAAFALLVSAVIPILSAKAQQQRRAVGPAGVPQAVVDSLRTEQARVTRLLHESEITTARLEGEMQAIETVAVLIGTLLAIATFTSLFGFIRGEGRSGQLHGLAVAGETAAQARAEVSHSAMLEASQRTLTLVNETLTLAKEQAERAAETLASKARRGLDQVERHAHEVLSFALQDQDFKVFVRQLDTKDGITAVAKELLAIEGYLQLRDIELPAICQFVKGMDRHLQQEPIAAVRYLRECARTSGERDLTAAALFWQGYELNNIGKFGEAALTFRKAAENVVPGSARYFELRRIAGESAFFEAASAFDQNEVSPTEEQVAELTDPFRRALDEATESGEEIRVAADIRQSLGNVYTWAARSSADEEQRKRFLAEARRCYVGGRGLYSQLGLLETAVALGEPGDDAPYREIVALSNSELGRRTEKRTIVLLEETRMIAQFRDRSSPPSEISQTFSNLKRAFKDVGSSVTVYSQLEKRNIERSQFEREADMLFRFMSANWEEPDGRTRPFPLKQGRQP